MIYSPFYINFEVLLAIIVIKLYTLDFSSLLEQFSLRVYLKKNYIVTSVVPTAE